MFAKLAGCLLVLASCGVELDVAPGTQIRCVDQGQCPSGLACNVSVGRCVSESDSGPLIITEAAATARFRVLVVFNKPLSDPPASDISRYTVVPGIDVHAVRVGDGGRSVTLLTSELRARTYELRVDGLVDVFGYAIADTDNTASFNGIGDVVDPNAPRTLVPIDTENLAGATSVELQWTAVGSAKEYFVEVALDPGFANPHPSAPADGYFTTTTSRLELPVQSESAYYWRVTSDANEGDSAIARFSTTAEEVFVYCPPGEACASGPTAPQWEAGTREAPFWSPARAVAAASRIGASTVKVAGRGSESYGGGLLLRDAVTLLGGWAPTFSERDSAAYPTRMSASTLVLQVIGSGATVLVDGFRIEASREAVLLANCDESVVLRNVVVDVPSDSVALAIDTSGPMGPVVEDCDLLGRVTVRGGAAPTFRRDLFLAEASTFTSSALHYDGGIRGSIEDSFFEGLGVSGQGGTDCLDVRITGNVLSTSGQPSVALVDVTCGLAFIANNLMWCGLGLGGMSDGTVGVNVTGSGSGASTVQLAHNTIVVRTEAAAASPVVTTGANVSLTNNLLMCEGAPNGIGITANGPDLNLPSIQHNGFVGCQDAVAHVLGSGPVFAYSSEAQLDALDGTGAFQSRVSGNVVAQLAPEQALVDLAGGNVAQATISSGRQLTRDWRLRLDPVGQLGHAEQRRLAVGGKSTEGMTCGSYVTPEACGDVVTDFTAASRTMPPSIGAYELDP